MSKSKYVWVIQKVVKGSIYNPDLYSFIIDDDENTLLKIKTLIVSCIKSDIDTCEESLSYYTEKGSDVMMMTYQNRLDSLQSELEWVFHCESVEDFKKVSTMSLEFM